MVVDGINLCIGAANVPKGKRWVSNNKSLWSKERKQWLINESEWRELYERGRASERVEQAGA